MDEKSQCSKAEIVLDPCTLAQGTEETTKPKTPQDETSPTVEVKPKAEEEVEKWGKPLGLPSPLPPGGPSRSMNNETNNKATRKQRSERSERKVTPVYMDLAYVPHHGDANYTDIEFFKRVRARYYVFSGVEPSRAVFDALLEGKKTWENKDLGKTKCNIFFAKSKLSFSISNEFFRIFCQMTKQHFSVKPKLSFSNFQIHEFHEFSGCLSMTEQ